MDGNDVIDKFVHSRLQLLSQEREEELQRFAHLCSGTSKKELEKLGQALRSLSVKKVTTGLGALASVHFEHSLHSSSHPHPLPPHSFRQGDVILVQPTKSLPTDDGVQAVVVRAKQCGICVSVRVPKRESLSPHHHEEDLYASMVGRDDRTAWSLIKRPNDVTYERCKRALNHLGSIKSYASTRSASHGEAILSLTKVLFGTLKPSLSPEEPLTWFNDSLNESQRAAVSFAMRSSHVAVIHGPPGTGKTTTVVEFIMQAVSRGQKVLATAPSNIAVDNIAERLLHRYSLMDGRDARARSRAVVRIGHPARVLPSVSRHTLEHLVQTSDGGAIVSDLRDEIRATSCKLQRTRGALRRGVWGEIRELRKELKAREVRALEEVLGSASVVLATCGGCGVRVMEHAKAFDVVVVDEAAQATEPATWIAMLKGAKVVLAGDHQQLPPTVLSASAVRGGLSRTVVDRLLAVHGDGIRSMLRVQYRMHRNIMAFSNQQMYGGELTAHSSVRTHRLSDVAHVEETLKAYDGPIDASRLKELVFSPTVFVDTAFCDGMRESDGGEESSMEGSKANEGEADIAMTHVTLLLISGVSPRDIAIITPYNAQVALLRDSIRSDRMASMVHRLMGCEAPSVARVEKSLLEVEIGSVDSFQGREKEAVVISLVRSNKESSVGFLSDDRRLNVALTRARRHLCLIGDSNTISSRPFLKRMVEHFTQCGVYESAAMYTLEMMEDGRADDGHASLGDDEKTSIPSPSIESNAGNPTTTSTTTPPTASSSPSIPPHEEEGDDDADYDGNDNIADSDDDDSISIDSSHADVADSYLAKAEDRILNAIKAWEDSGESDPLAFPSSLSSFERRLVHGVAERMGLSHWSQGNGKSRRIMVDVKQPHNTSTTTSTTASTSNTATIAKGTHTPSGSCSNIHAHASSASPTTTPAPRRGKGGGAAKTPPRGKAKSRTSGAHASTPPSPSPAPGMRDTRQSKAKAKSPHVCAHGKCEKNTKLISSTCKFCQRRFCFTHGIPEAHGCGASAKAHARKEFEDNWKNKDGLSRKDLRKKLQEKREEKADSRKSTRSQGRGRGSGARARRRRRGRRR